jgi:hypothetical protein
LYGHLLIAVQLRPTTDGGHSIYHCATGTSCTHFVEDHLRTSNRARRANSVSIAAAVGWVPGYTRQSAFMRNRTAGIASTRSNCNPRVAKLCLRRRIGLRVARARRQPAQLYPMQQPAGGWRASQPALCLSCCVGNAKNMTERDRAHTPPVGPANICGHGVRAHRGDRVAGRTSLDSNPRCLRAPD